MPAPHKTNVPPHVPRSDTTPAPHEKYTIPPQAHYEVPAPNLTMKYQHLTTKYPTSL